MNNFTVINKGSNGKVSIMLTGVVSSYDSDHSFKAATFINEFTKLQENSNHIHIDIVNFYGGSITEGIPIYNHIKEVVNAGKIKITGKIDGLAASMGSIIAMAIPADDLEMANMARLMNHCAKGGVYGTAAQVRNTAQLIEDLENDLVNILAERTGWTAEKVKQTWMDGLDHYITASKAKELKLVGKTTASKVIKKEPKNLTTPDAIYNFYQNQIVNITKPDNMNIVSFISAFAKAGIDLPSNADEPAILVAVKDLIDKNSQLVVDLDQAQNKLQNQEEAAINDLVENAIKAGKISKAQEPAIKAMAKSDFKNAKTFLENQSVHKPLTNQLNKGGNEEPETPPNNQTTKDWDWYRKNASNDLAKMKRENPEEYQALKDAKFQNG